MVCWNLLPDFSRRGDILRLYHSGADAVHSALIALSGLSRLSGFLPLVSDNVFPEATFVVERGAGDPDIRKAGGISRDSVGKRVALDVSTIPGDQLKKINRLHAEPGYAALTR